MSTNSLPRVHIEVVAAQGCGAHYEDRMIVNPHILGVFDGATSLVLSPQNNNLTGGEIAANIALDAILHSPFALAASLKMANSRIDQAQQSASASALSPLQRWGTTAAVIRLLEEGFEWAQIGDSAILVIRDTDTVESLGDCHDHDTDTKALYARLIHAHDPSAQEKLREDIVRVRSLANTSYGVLNGDPLASRFINTGTCKLDGIKHILLLTDGLYPPRHNPSNEDDFTMLAAIYRELGLAGLLHHIRAIEKSDPECRIYPRLKQSDDATGIAITVNQLSN